ncbi:TlpA family protein disulfide reductase [Ascidiimonas sp. W6]|uniref:TlpA family protein disulfide reductase n=1 Tax=Ascidiimonas meishanensis TaxID=3128903 RepID=UPI0030EC2CAF
MKKSTLIIISLQILTMAGVAATAYFTYMNKARIQAAQRVIVNTQEDMLSTVSFIKKVQAAQEQLESLNKALEPGTPASEFALKDEQNNEVALNDFKGKKVLVVFSQEGCGYCEQFYPVLNEFTAQSHPGLEVVMMQLNSSSEANKAFKANKKINIPVLAATEEELINYRIKGTPTSVLINEEGIVVGSRNVLNMEELIAFVEAE